jgi:hypothetical protein
MVISNKHKFLFCRIPKNASTSLATFFVRNCCDNNDVYTMIGDSGTKATNVPDSTINKYRTEYRMIHLTLQEIIYEKLYTVEQAMSWDNIGVIRDPLERQLSLFFFKHRGSADVNKFRQLVERGYHETDGSNHILQCDYLSWEGEQVGTYWPYDQIDQKLEQFVLSKGIQVKESLKTYKSQFKPGEMKSLIDKYYDKKTKDAVMKYFALDYELYNKISTTR